MSERKEQVRITLTPEQKELIRKTTGQDAGSLEMTVQELEERIAPARFV